MFKWNHGFKIQSNENSNWGNWNTPIVDHYLLKMAESQFKDLLLFMVLCLRQPAKTQNQFKHTLNDAHDWIDCVKTIALRFTLCSICLAFAFVLLQA